MTKKNEEPEIIKEGAKTIYRPNDDRLQGNANQTAARGEKGSQDLVSTSATSGGAAGTTEDLGDTEK